MEAIQIEGRDSKQNARRTAKITTTLYDLMETVIDVADPDENKLVNEVTLNILAKAKPRISNRDHRVIIRDSLISKDSLVFS